jgi:hypothetical protein
MENVNILGFLRRREKPDVGASSAFIVSEMEQSRGHEKRPHREGGGDGSRSAPLVSRTIPTVRLWSSHESVRRGEPTVLAILETLAAMAVSVWIGIHFGTWMHIAMGAAIAPLLLLRTDESCRRGLRWAAAAKLRPLVKLGEGEGRPIWRAARWRAPGEEEDLEAVPQLRRKHPITVANMAVIGAVVAMLVGVIMGAVIGTVVAMVMVVAVVGVMGAAFILLTPKEVAREFEAPISTMVAATAVIGMVIRFAATLAEISHGPRMIRAIPGNWWRVVVATDFVESPEFLPDPMEASSSDTQGELNWEVYRWLDEASKDPVFRRRVLLVVGMLPFACIAFSYRLSLKSTALVWFPLLWALRPVKPANLDWRKHLEIGAELGKTRFVGAVSALCILFLAAKYVLWTGRHGLALEAEAWRDLLRSWSSALADSALADGLVGYVRPGALPLWQVAMLLNSLLGIFVWWKVRTWLAYFRHDVPPSDKSITRTLAVTFFFRRLLTSYVIVCNGFMALQLARRFPVPEIGWRMFPWV